MRGCLRAIAELFEDFKDSKIQSGDSWEALFLIVLLVRCLSRQFDDMILPLVDILTRHKSATTSPILAIIFTPKVLRNFSVVSR